MTTIPFPLREETSAFDPLALRVLSKAFDEAWQSVQANGTTFDTAGEAEETRELLAKCIIERAKLGDRDQDRLRTAALIRLAEVKLRKPRK